MRILLVALAGLLPLLFSVASAQTSTPPITIILPSSAGGGGVGCVPAGGQPTNIVLYGSGGVCTPAPDANISGGSLTLGLASTVGGTLVLEGSTSGAATLTGGTTGAFTSSSAWALSGLVTLTGVSNALGTPLSLTLTNATSLPISTGLTGAGTGVLTALGNAVNTSGGVSTGAAVLTANLPVIGGGSGTGLNVGTRSGNTTAYVTTTGAQTSGDCVKIDASGNHVANGSACGGSSGLTVGTTTITSGAANRVLTDNGGTLTELAYGLTGNSTIVETTSGGLLTASILPLATTGAFGAVKPDGVTVTISGGVISSVGGAATTITPGTTTIAGATAPCLIENSSSTVMACAGVGTGVIGALGNNVGSAGAPVVFNGAGGTPSSIALTNGTVLPLTTGVTGVLPVANGGSNASTVAGARSSFGVDQRSQYGSTTVNLAATDHYVTACNNNNSACSTSTWSAAAVWTLPLHSAVNDGDTISIADDLGIVTPTNTLSLVPNTVNAINGSGQIAAGGTISTGSATITMSQNGPPWLVAGSNVYDVTGSVQIGTVSTWPSNSTTLTLTGNASNNGTGSSDVLLFSPNTGATSNKFTINAAFGAASCKLDATTQNWACFGSVANGAAGTVLIGQSNGAPAMTAISGDGTLSSAGALNIVTVTPSGSTRREPMTADALFQDNSGSGISNKTFASSGAKIKGSSTGTTALASANAGASNFTATIPAATDTVVMLAESQTLTNKTLTSPTLVTPALGTIASGDLTSGTNIPVANAKSGSILPAANGGAGTINGALKANGSGVVSQANCASLSDAGLCVAAVDGTTITNTANVISAANQIGFPGYVAANYYEPVTAQGANGNGAALSTTTTYCFPGGVSQKMSTNKLAASTTTPGSSNIQLAVYGAGSWGRPGSLIAATGNIDNTPAAGVVSGSITNSSLPIGTYWWCLQANDTTVRMRSFSITQATNFTMTLGSATAANVFGSVQVTGILTTGTTFGTWPNFTSGTAWTDNTSTGVPILGFQVNTVP